MRFRTDWGLIVVLTVAVALWPATTRATQLEPAPVWQNETLMGPARSAADLVKAKFTYDAESKKLTFRLDLKRVEMTLGSKSATIDGETKTLSEAPKVINGTSYVPLKSLLIGLGCGLKSGGENVWIVCIEKLCIRLEVPPKPE